MKRFYICLYIVAAMLAISLYSYFYTRAAIDGVIERLEHIEEAIKMDDKSLVTVYAQEADGIWQDYFDFQIFLADKDHAVDVSSSLARVASLSNHDGDEILDEVAVAMKLISLYKVEQSVHILNLM